MGGRCAMSWHDLDLTFDLAKFKNFVKSILGRDIG